MKNFKITLPIKYYTEDSMKAQELGLPGGDEYQVKNMTFYQIDAVGPNIENPEHAIIYTPGNHFTTIYTEKEVIELIDEQLKINH